MSHDHVLFEPQAAENTYQCNATIETREHKGTRNRQLRLNVGNGTRTILVCPADGSANFCPADGSGK